MLLDGVIQLTEKDETAYHEMIAHIPLFKSSNPERILLVGGGDGGSMREILKHSTVKQVTMCEIDEMVMKVSEKFFPPLKLKESLQDTRVKVVHSDASEYMKEQKEHFDIIIVDSSDPVYLRPPFLNSLFSTLCFTHFDQVGKFALKRNASG